MCPWQCFVPSMAEGSSVVWLHDILLEGAVVLLEILCNTGLITTAPLLLSC